jgi:hypothetical protein
MSQSKSNRLFWRRFVSSEPAQVTIDIPPQSSPTYPTPWLPIPQKPDFRRGRGGGRGTIDRMSHATLAAQLTRWRKSRNILLLFHRTTPSKVFFNTLKYFCMATKICTIPLGYGVQARKMSEKIAVAIAVST